MTREDMRAHYERFYRPGNATLVIAGDVDVEAFAEAERHFGGIVDPHGPVSRRPSRRDARPRQRRAHEHVGRPGAPPDHGLARRDLRGDEDFALDVVVTVLTSGKLGSTGASSSGRRWRDVSANNDARAEAGGRIYAEASRARTPRPSRRRSRCALASEPVAEEELARAKKLLSASEAFESETTTELAETLGEYATDLEWRDALDVTRRRDAVTAQGLQETCARLLDPGRRVVAWSRPAAAGEEGGDA